MSEDRLERALQAMKAESVDSGTLEGARTRVWEQVKHAGSATCAEFREDLHEYLADALGGSRRGRRRLNKRDDARLGRDREERLSIRLGGIELHVEATGSERDEGVQHAGLASEHALDESGLSFVAQADRRCRQVFIAPLECGAGALNEGLHLFNPHRGGLVVKAQLRARRVLAIDVHPRDASSCSKSLDHPPDARIARYSVARQRELQIELVLLHAAPCGSAASPPMSAAGS